MIMTDSWTPIEAMSTDDKINEMLLIMRALADALNGLGANMGNNSPMMNVILRATGADKIKIEP
jgi:hypothetical protein